MTVLLVAIGGALGSVARYLLSPFIQRLSGTLFPIGTFSINVMGCVVFGVIVGIAQQRFALSPNARGFLLIGVIGGFTTFSTFAFETFELLRDGQFLWAVVNVAGQAVAGLVGLWVGYVITS